MPRGGGPDDDAVRLRATRTELPDTDRYEERCRERAAERPLRAPRAAGRRGGPRGFRRVDGPDDTRPEAGPVRFGHDDVLLEQGAETAQPFGLALAHPTSRQMGGRRARRPVIESPVEVGPQPSSVQIVAQHVGWTAAPPAVILMTHHDIRAADDRPGGRRDPRGPAPRTAASQPARPHQP